MVWYLVTWNTQHHRMWEQSLANTFWAICVPVLWCVPHNTIGRAVEETSTGTWLLFPVTKWTEVLLSGRWTTLSPSSRFDCWTSNNFLQIDVKVKTVLLKQLDSRCYCERYCTSFVVSYRTTKGQHSPWRCISEGVLRGYYSRSIDNNCNGISNIRRQFGY